ncbi:MAG: DUF86 domain-containing protein [Bryobacteraceae bacterium]
MPFKDEDGSLRDILAAIEMIEAFTSGMDFEEFRGDPKTIAAVERKLQIVSEAAIRLGPDAESRFPGLRWRNIRGMGNWLRHQYDRLELPVIWKSVQADLPPLKTAVLRALNPPTADPAKSTLQ